MPHPVSLIVDQLKTASPHFRIIVPAAAALIWTVKRITGHHDEPCPLDDDEAALLGATICNVVVASGKRSAAPRLPYKVPVGKSNVLLDVLIPTTVSEFWKAIFQNDSDAFERYHESMGDKDIYVGSWREKEEKTGEGTDEERLEKLRRRRVSFIKPLKNPLGPKQAVNQETFRVVHLTPYGFTVECICKTSGVPFSSSFQNELQWVGYEVEAGVMRLIVSGECVFTDAVFGMLKNTISRESVAGMKRAYDVHFREIVRARLGIIEDEHEDKKRGAVVLSSKGGVADGVINIAATNPAVLVALLATIIIVLRILTQQSFYAHLLRKMVA